jgi:hypothetical protein
MAKNSKAYFVKTSMHSIGNLSFPTAEASYPAHIKAYPLTVTSDEPAFGFVIVSYNVLRMTS